MCRTNFVITLDTAVADMMFYSVGARNKPCEFRISV